MMIELIPAIDLIDGQCVRLCKGNYDQKTIYSSSPAEVAEQFEQMGFKRLHVVDLDGAKSRHIVNDHVLREITTRTNLIVDFGGGIKTDDDMKKAFDAGAQMVTVGSIAVTEPKMLERWLGEYGADRIILGADVKKGLISINGWKEERGQQLMDFLDTYTRMGVTKVLCTEISRDGMLQGPATQLYKQIMERFPNLHLIASGGVSCNDDIINLEREGIPAVVFGKAFYEGRIDVKQLGLC